MNFSIDCSVLLNREENELSNLNQNTKSPVLLINGKEQLKIKIPILVASIGPNELLDCSHIVSIFLYDNF